MLDERVLTERLVRYDTSHPDGILAAAAFARGWLEARDIDVRSIDHFGLPLLVAEAGATDPAAPTVVFHGHIDVVPGHAHQFAPRLDGDRLIGRGSYDMKGGLAAMMCALKDIEAQDRVRVRLVIVPDEESEELDHRSTDAFVESGLGGDFAITGEPTNLHIGVEAKGVLAMRIEVRGRSAHSSTPWLGDNAILKAVDAFRTIEALPFSRESSEMFDRPSINMGKIHGGDALNKVPDHCAITVDVRFLPGQDPQEILAQIGRIPDIEITRTFIHPTVRVSRHDPHVKALKEAVARANRGEVMSVGRDGASDAASFIAAGIPAVEFGPQGGGHHGPEEWISVSSLIRYRRALGDFIRTLPMHLEERRTSGSPAPEPPLANPPGLRSGRKPHPQRRAADQHPPPQRPASSNGHTGNLPA